MGKLMHLAFQAEYEGSIPFTRSKQITDFAVALPRRFGARIPGAQQKPAFQWLEAEPVS
jgi:hypothetical protein